MAKLTGQFTTPSLDAQNNKTHKPFLHGVVFIFTGATKVVRETDAKGKYSFDLANGEYEVSVYLKGNTEKDRFDMRAGEKFTVTATTQADALEKWLQVIGTSGKDELATYYENLLAQMQKVANDFKKDTEFVGTGKFLKEGAYGLGSSGIPSLANAVPILANGVYGGVGGAGDLFKYGPFFHIVRAGSQRALQLGYETISTGLSYRAHDQVSGWTGTYLLYSSQNTAIDSNGFIKAASPIIKLFNDRIEHSGFGDNEPIFEKLSTGTYKISNTLGLAQEGWTYEKPRGGDGQPYFRIIVEKLEDGCIITVHDEYIDYDDIEIIDENGNKRTVKEGVTVLSAVRDIKEHERWIDLRFHEEIEEHKDEELLAEY